MYRLDLNVDGFFFFFDFPVDSYNHAQAAAFGAFFTFFEHVVAAFEFAGDFFIAGFAFDCCQDWRVLYF